MVVLVLFGRGVAGIGMAGMAGRFNGDERRQNFKTGTT